jgi:hypothetical protein
MIGKTMASNKYKRKYQKLRDSARNEECTLRIHPYCNNNPETVVLCHLPSGSGMGQKSPDWFAVYGCSACHDILDGRVSKADISDDHKDLLSLDALYLTLDRMIEKGLIKI